jgi:solute carrier family 35 protein C2
VEPHYFPYVDQIREGMPSDPLAKELALSSEWKTETTMTSDFVVSHWLQNQQHKPPAAPDSLADEFPLATIPSPPSSSLSDIVSSAAPDSTPADVAGLVHPPTPSMDEHSVENHARRRSSSLAGLQGPAKKTHKGHGRRRSEYIPEEGGEGSTSDPESDSSEKTDSDDDDMRSSDGLEDDEETGLTGRDRRRRRRRKRRATLLDQRIAGDVHITKEEEKLANESMLRNILINVLLVCLWYVSAIAELLIRNLT